jgi:hypothetical protein
VDHLPERLGHVEISEISKKPRAMTFCPSGRKNADLKNPMEVGAHNTKGYKIPIATGT